MEESIESYIMEKLSNNMESTEEKFMLKECNISDEEIERDKAEKRIRMENLAQYLIDKLQAGEIEITTFGLHNDEYGNRDQMYFAIKGEEEFYSKVWKIGCL